MVEVVIGRIGRAHGVRGEVSVDLRTDEPERRFQLGTEVRVSPARSLGLLTIAGVRPHSGRLLVSFRQVRDRTSAEQLRGATISIDVDPGDRPHDPEEFYDHQLVGLRVRSPAGAELGTVGSVLHLPAHDVLAVRLDEEREVLVPFVADMVPVVDVDAGFLQVLDSAELLVTDDAPAKGAEGSTTTSPG